MRGPRGEDWSGGDVRENGGGSISQIHPAEKLAKKRKKLAKTVRFNLFRILEIN